MLRMIRPKEALWLFLIVFCTASATLVGNLRSRGQVPYSQEQQANKKKERVEEFQGPIVDYAQTQAVDPVGLAKRRIRGAKHDKSQWNVSPEDSADTTVLVDAVDPNLPAFPVTKSTAVILGDITDAKAYLSNDRKGVYTEFTVRVEEIFKDGPQTLLTTDGTLEISRQGGRVRFPSGREHLYKVSEETMPRVGGRYVFFLTGNHDQGFSILTAYELQAGKIIPLDNLPGAQVHKNADQTTLLNHLRIKTTIPGSLQ
jgi:hypothetical protein